MKNQKVVYEMNRSEKLTNVILIYVLFMIVVLYNYFYGYINSETVWYNFNVCNFGIVIAFLFRYSWYYN